jgi:hypothetical protein
MYIQNGPPWPPYIVGNSAPDSIESIEKTLTFLERLKESYKKSDEEAKKKEKEKEKEKKKPEGMSKGELFLLMLLMSPLVGWAYSYAMVLAYSGMKDNLSHMLK